MEIGEMRRENTFEHNPRLFPRPCLNEKLFLAVWIGDFVGIAEAAAAVGGDGGG